jgi:hypothetical protein
VARTEGTGSQRRAHQSMASGYSRAWKLTVGGTTERGEHRELGSSLTGAQAAARWPGDGGKQQRRSVLSGVGVSDSEVSKGGRGECGDGRGCSSSFY